MKLSHDQSEALKLLKSDGNIFLTGAAGSGKSTLLREYLKNTDIPILASTGAAAILVGGRTFHSFFGLGIMEGGEAATIERAMKNKRLIKRLKKTDAVVIDEISMISGPTLRTAEQIVRRARGKKAVWGGMRIIAVGDFAQLPPVNPFSRQREWAFLDPVWEASNFQTVVLSEIMRSSDEQFLKILNQVRNGDTSGEVKEFLDSRLKATPDGEFTRLFAHRKDVETFNLQKLGEIKNPVEIYKTIYDGKERDVENFKRHSPIGDAIHLKKNALVMLRQNDPEGRWVNGSLGRVERMSSDVIAIKLLSGRTIDLEKANFTLLDAEGKVVVTATNFPLTLAWAMTIHKAQGATLDRMLVNLERVWEPGQAYVALSRVRTPEGLFLEGWNAKCIFTDPDVARFSSQLTTL